jgi:transposase
MIPAGAKVYVTTRPVDFRKGPDGLAALVRDMGADPFSGALYVFRAKRADRVKIVGGTGLGFACSPSGRTRTSSADRGWRTA